MAEDDPPARPDIPQLLLDYIPALVETRADLSSSDHSLEHLVGIGSGTLLVAEQASLDPALRRPVTMIADEFHSLAGANCEAIAKRVQPLSHLPANNLDGPL